MREHPAFARLRGDARANLLGVAGVLAAHMDWELSTSRPTWEVLAARTGLSRRTVARHLAALRAAGLLGIVEHGTTPQFSPGVLQLRPRRVAGDVDGQGTGQGDAADAGGGSGNTASVYLLIAPRRLRLVAVARAEDVGAEWVDAGPVDAVEAPTWHRDDAPDSGQDDDQGDGPGDVEDQAHDGTRPVDGAGDGPHTAARGVPVGVGAAGREDVVRPRGRGPVDISGTPSPPGRGVRSPAYARATRNRPQPEPSRPVQRWAGRQRPATKPDRAAAAAEARRQVPDLARISTPHVAALLREWWLAGWSLDDVLTALSRPPEGPAHRNTTQVAHVPGWVRSRLAWWRTNPADPTSPPASSPSARAAAERTRAAAADRAHRDRQAAAVAVHALDPALDPALDSAQAGDQGGAAAVAARGIAAARAALHAARTDNPGTSRSGGATNHSQGDGDSDGRSDEQGP